MNSLGHITYIQYTYKYSMYSTEYLHIKVGFAPASSQSLRERGIVSKKDKWDQHRNCLYEQIGITSKIQKHQMKQIGLTSNCVLSTF